MNFNSTNEAQLFGSQRAFLPVGHCAPGCLSKCFSFEFGQARMRRRPIDKPAVEMTIAADERECTVQLARFFPKLPAVRIPVQVIPHRPGQVRMKETTVVEFGTGEYAIFLSQLGLEFDDRVRMVRDGGGRSVEAAVIALQYHDGRKAVAVRFLDGPCEWMMHP